MSIDKKIDNRKVYIRELVKQIDFALKEISRVNLMTKEEFEMKIATNRRIAWTINGLYNGDGLVEPLKEKGESKK